MTAEIEDATKKNEATLTITGLWMELSMNEFRVSS